MNSAELIFLIGYRGSGKTAVAQLVAQRLGWDWCDADAVLEARFARTIRTIFAEEGEAGFRDKETQVLRDLAGLRKHVVATGGGVVLRSENRGLLRHGHVVWLTAAPSVLWQRIQADRSTAERRPNLTGGGLQEIEELLAQRQPLYAECAQLTIDTTDRSCPEVAQVLIESLGSPL